MGKNFAAQLKEDITVYLSYLDQFEESCDIKRYYEIMCAAAKEMCSRVPSLMKDSSKLKTLDDAAYHIFYTSHYVDITQLEYEGGKIMPQEIIDEAALLRKKTNKVNVPELIHNFYDFTELLRLLALTCYKPFYYTKNSDQFLKTIELPSSFSEECREFFCEHFGFKTCFYHEPCKITHISVIADIPTEYRKEYEKVLSIIGNDEICRFMTSELTSISSNNPSEYSKLFLDAAKIVTDFKSASTSLLQRKLKLGYARAAALIDELEEAGIISGYNGSLPRRVLLNNFDPSAYSSSQDKSLSNDPYAPMIAAAVFPNSIWTIDREYLFAALDILKSEPEINLPSMAIQLLSVFDEPEMISNLRYFKRLYEQ